MNDNPAARRIAKAAALAPEPKADPAALERAATTIAATQYQPGTYSQRNTGEACWSCAGLMGRAPGDGCIYPESHH